MISKDQIVKVASEVFGKDITIDDLVIGTPPDKTLGDYAIVCFVLSKILGMSPQDIATKLAEALESKGVFPKATPDGGFINVSVSDADMISSLEQFTFPSYEKKDEIVIVDYIGANIGKPLHIGHMCTPTYGQAGMNLLRYAGYEVISDVHQGDWGIIFGKLLFAWERYGDEDEFSKKPIHHLLDLYIKITADADEEDDLDQQFRDTFARLSEGDEVYIELWKRFTAESLEQLRQVMARLHVHFDIAVGESFYEGLGLPKFGDHPDLKLPEQTMSHIVEELIEKGVATRNDDESAGIEFSKESKLPSTILQKRDGTHGYLASDMGTLRYRLDTWSPSRVLYFVDERQKLHLQQVFETAKQAWEECQDVELTHCSNGTVRLKDGAMSTRRGKIVFLEDLLSEGVTRTQKILDEKERTLAESDIEAIAIGAIKYTFLAQDREKDIVFDWDKVLAFEGNSGPYIQYTIVRARKILRDIGDVSGNAAAEVELTQYDRELVKDLYELPKIFEGLLETYKFHPLAQWCYETSSDLNSFYTNTSKLMEEQDENLKAFRVKLLTEIVAALEKSFEIMAIPVPEKM